MKKQLIEFFAAHTVDTVFEALGVLFIEQEKAEAFVGGTSGTVTTYTRAEVEQMAADDEAAAKEAADKAAADEAAAKAAADKAAADEAAAKEAADKAAADEAAAKEAADKAAADEAAEKKAAGKNKTGKQ